MMKPNKPLLTSPQPTQPPQPIEVTCSASEPGSCMESQYLSKACLEKPSLCPGPQVPSPLETQRRYPTLPARPCAQRYAFLLSL